MACDETMTIRSSIHEDDDVGSDDMSMFMSRLSMEASDGDADEEFSGDKQSKGISSESSDSDKDPDCLSLPATPVRRRILRERWLERAWEKKKKKNMWRSMDEENSQSDESESLNGNNEGKRGSLFIDLEEVKGCRDLGFELEEEKRIPCLISMSCSNIDTSSGGNSPISNWRISSPGDDPRDVKARLKVWAQAVALASASHIVS